MHLTDDFVTPPPLKRMKLSLKSQRFYSHIHRQDSVGSSHSSSGASPPSLSHHSADCSDRGSDRSNSSQSSSTHKLNESYSGKHRDLREWKQSWSPPSLRSLDSHISDNSYSEIRVQEDKKNISTLRNLGNTCFLNSILYILRYTPGFTQALHTLVSTCHQLLASKDKGSKLCLLDSKLPSSVYLVLALHEVYEKMYQVEKEEALTSKLQENGTKYILTIDRMLTALRGVNPMYEGCTQHDAHELLGCLISVMDEATQYLQEVSLVTRNRPSSSHSRKASRKRATKRAADRQSGSPSLDRSSEGSSEASDASETTAQMDCISRMFTGQVYLQTRCLECEHFVQSEETFIDISVPVDGPPISFVQALQQRTQLNGDNKYFCSCCQHSNEADRSAHFLNLPPIVTIQLQRFAPSDDESGEIMKLLNHVTIPLDLPCFSEGCARPCQNAAHKYKLFGVVFHMGSSVTSGHYTALIRTQLNTYKQDFSSSPHSKSHRSGSVSSNSSTSSKNSGGVKLDGKVASHCCGLGSHPDWRDYYTNWLFFDDEKVTGLQEGQVWQLLQDGESSHLHGTPYLLFYANAIKRN